MLSIEIRDSDRFKRVAPRRGHKLTVMIGVALGIGAVVTAFPFIWMIASSVKPQQESLSNPPSIKIGRAHV